jgi:Orsellinic acid/F9775 biosynthesis cluster protein D
LTNSFESFHIININNIKSATMSNPILFRNIYFERLAEFPIVVCRECHYGVWPSQIEGHLQRAHRHVLPAIRIQLAEEVCSWPNIAIDPIELDIPAIWA